MLTIRPARPSDIPAIAAIYQEAVRTGTASWELEPPTEAEMLKRFEAITGGGYPYLVAEEEGRLIGYAYAGRFQPREAYDWAVETSIYLDVDVRGRGIGTWLHAELEGACRSMNVQNMDACIAAPREADDPHLTDASIGFHEHLGYRMVGRFEQVGYKFGRWYDMVWMERLIGDHATPASPVVAYRG